MLENVAYLGHALVLEGAEGIDFRCGAYVLVMCIVVLDAFGTERFDTGHGGAEVGEGLPFVFQTVLLDLLGGQLRCVQI